MSHRVTILDWPNTTLMMQDLDVPQGVESRRMERRHSNDESWSGAKSWEDAKRLAMYGFNRSLAEFAAEDAQLGRGLAPRRLHDVVGGSTDIGRAAIGAPDAMVKRTRRESPAFINALIHIGGNCNLSRKALEARGINMLRCVRALEENGSRVSLTVCAYTDCHSDKTGGGSWDDNGGHRAILSMVRLKTFSAFVDPQEVAFYMTHVAAFRWLMFRAWQMTVGDAGLVGAWTNLGHSEDVPEEYRRDFDFYVPQIWSDEDKTTPQEMMTAALATKAKRLAWTPNPEE